MLIHSCDGRKEGDNEVRRFLTSHTGRFWMMSEAFIFCPLDAINCTCTKRRAKGDQKVAEIKKVSFEEVEEVTTRRAKQLFKLEI